METRWKPGYERRGEFVVDGRRPTNVKLMTVFEEGEELGPLSESDRPMRRYSIAYLGRQFTEAYSNPLLEGCVVGVGEVQCGCADLDTSWINATVFG